MPHLASHESVVSQVLCQRKSLVQDLPASGPSSPVLELSVCVLPKGCKVCQAIFATLQSGTVKGLCEAFHAKAHDQHEVSQLLSASRAFLTVSKKVPARGKLRLFKQEVQPMQSPISIQGRRFWSPCCTKTSTALARVLPSETDRIRSRLTRSGSSNSLRVAVMATGGRSASQGMVSGLFRLAGRTSTRTMRLAASVLISLVLMARAWRLFVRCRQGCPRLQLF